ncbi:MAG: HAD family hydrolase [Mycoplasmatales bacterium]|nr:HAD family hydrolase [Mycoplasmatales bacterium]
MDKRKIKYTYFDLDGTLLNDDKIISSNTIKAINILKRNNIKIGIATGRPFILTKKIAEIIKPDLPTIAINGGLIVDKDGNLILDKFIKKKISKQIIDFLINNKIDFLVYTNNKIYFNNVTNPSWFNFLKNEMKQNSNSEEKLKIIRPTDENINKILILNQNLTNKNINKIQEYLSNFDDIYTVKSQKDVLDIMPKNITKGKALLKVESDGFINLEETMTWGDGDNDINMFNVSSLSIAMPKANSKVKSSADLSLDENNQNHIYNFVMENWT